jgi:hypothetical protein
VEREISRKRTHAEMTDEEFDFVDSVSVLPSLN